MTFSTPLRVFVSYADEDERHCRDLERHLSVLVRQKFLEIVHRGKQLPGADSLHETSLELDTADVILLLVSADFLASTRIWDVELAKAVQRHATGQTAIVPIILRDVQWDGTPFAGLASLPKDGRPVLAYEDRDSAWAHVVEGLSRLLRQLRPKAMPNSQVPANARADNIHERLAQLYVERESLAISGNDTRAVNDQILDLRRLQRQGHQLRANEFLGDGRFRLLDILGRGGFGTVWKAYDRLASELVAIKVMHSQDSAHSQHQERFYRGARVMARLQHPHAVRIIERPRQDTGFHFFAMEYLERGDLRRAVLSGEISPGSALDLLSELAGVLDHAHALGVVHRDVKPANVLLDRNLRAKLADFDLVLMDGSTGGTRTGALGTFLYAAPETMENAQSATAAADVYSLAMTIAFVLYGRDLPIQVLRDASALVSQLPCDLAAKRALLRALDWDPGARFPSVGAFESAFRGEDESSLLLSPVPATAPPEASLGIVSIGSGGFFTPTEIQAVVSRSGFLPVGEVATGELLLFDNDTQHTWLVISPTKAAIVLDDENTRAKNLLVQRVMNKTEVLPLSFTVPVRHDGTGSVGFGTKPSQKWYYSTKLFPTTDSLTAALNHLLGKRVSARGGAT